MHASDLLRNLQCTVVISSEMLRRSDLTQQNRGGRHRLCLASPQEPSLAANTLHPLPAAAANLSRVEWGITKANVQQLQCPFPDSRGTWWWPWGAWCLFWHHLGSLMDKVFAEQTWGSELSKLILKSWALWLACTCNPRARVTETSGPLGLSVQSSWNGEHHVSMRDLENQGRLSPEEGHLKLISGLYTYMSTCMHSHTCAHTCTHILKQKKRWKR